VFLDGSLNLIGFANLHSGTGRGHPHEGVSLTILEGVVAHITVVRLSFVLISKNDIQRHLVTDVAEVFTTRLSFNLLSEFLMIFDNGVTKAYPATATAVPGIILTGCQITGFSENAKIHNMETRNSLITYIGCSIKGDISSVGTDTTDQGLGKVIIGEGTTFTAENAEFVKVYNESDVSNYDGTKSGVYLSKDTTVASTSSGFIVVKQE
jgi:hypothetical protein